MTRRLLCLWLLAGLLVTGCTPAATLDMAQVAAAANGTLHVVGTQVAIGETETATQLWPTPTIAPSPTNTATFTPTPTDTASPTATATPLPNGTVVGAIRLRAGPGLEYPGGAQLAGGETATPLGRTAETGWLLIALTDGTQGWLPADKFQLAADSPDLPIITDIPPTPTLPPPPTATPTPVPTETFTPSPWLCNFSVYASPAFKGQLILEGSSWPPGRPVTLIVDGVNRGDKIFGTGQADSPSYPYGFWHTWGLGSKKSGESITFVAQVLPECSTTAIYTIP
jgi:hypothetical protein